MGYTSNNNNNLVDSLPKGAVTSQGVYVPPHLRGFLFFLIFRKFFSIC